MRRKWLENPGGGISRIEELTPESQNKEDASTDLSTSGIELKNAFQLTEQPQKELTENSKNAGQTAKKQV